MKAKIVAIKNGPLVLESDDNHTIIYKDHKNIPAGNPAYLCRCGQSKTKPFCDGTHTGVNFQSKRDIKDETIQRYEGKEITVTFNRSICAGASNCVKHQAVFSSHQASNWINPDNDSKESIIKTVQSCPSGALSYTIGAITNIDSRDKAKISVIKNGPYYVEAIEYDFKPQPTHFSNSKYALCRCGLSKNKPYCDYTHAQQKWNDQA